MTEPGPNADSSRASRRSVLARSGAALGACGLAGCLGSGSSPDAGTGAGADADATPEVVAHRGCAAEAPENTVAAVEAAAPVVDRIELDVRRCGTGELVAFHDATLDRVTDASGRVDETPLATLSGLSVDGSAEPVPTLAAAVAAVPADVGVMLDLKADGLVEDALAVGSDRDDDPLVASDDPDVLRAVRTADPTVPTAFGVRESPPNRALRPFVPGPARALYVPEDTAGVVARTADLGCAVVSPRYELCLATDIVARAHAAGLRVFPWTTATERAFDALAAAGVDAVVSDVCRGLRE